MLLLSLLSSFFSFSLEVHGHRGAPANYPENTLVGIEHAMQMGVDFIELDVHYTKDHQLVVHHDPYINSKNCQYKDGRAIEQRRAIYKLTLNEIKEFDCGSKVNSKFPNQKPSPGEEIPSLHQVFQMLQVNQYWNSPSKLNIEIKFDQNKKELYPDVLSYLYHFIELIEHYNISNRIMVQSFSKVFIIFLERMMPNYHTSYLSKFPIDMDEILKEGVDAISIHHLFLRKDDVKKIRNYGAKVYVWTANKKSLWRRLIDFNVNGIITDDPIGLQNHLNTIRN